MKPIDQISIRYILVYSLNKLNYLRDCGFRYIFKAVDVEKSAKEGKNVYFYVFDRNRNIECCLQDYKSPTKN